MGIKDIINKIKGAGYDEPEPKVPESFEALWRQILIREDRGMGMLAFYNLPCPERDREAYEAKVRWAQDLARKEMNGGEEAEGGA
jgi:hypothetical protein